jgi:hypothetical protein
VLSLEPELRSALAAVSSSCAEATPVPAMATAVAVPTVKRVFLRVIGELLGEVWM